MDALQRTAALAKLNDPSTTPVANLIGLILSAYSKDNQLDEAYTGKYKSTYSALIEVSNYLSVQNRIKKDGGAECTEAKLEDLKQKLTDKGFVGEALDLSELISAMKFHTTSANALSDLSDFDDVDDFKEGKPIDIAVEEINGFMRLIDKAHKSLYESVFTALRPKGAYSRTAPAGYPHGIIRHNTAQNPENKGKAGSDSLVMPSSGAIDRIKLLYEAMGLTQLVESGAVSVDKLGNPNNKFYFPRQAGRFASGVVAGKDPRYASGDAFNTARSAWVRQKLEAVAAGHKGDQNSLRAALRAATHSLATSVVIDAFDTSVAFLLVIKVCAPAINDSLVLNADELQAVYRKANCDTVSVRGVSTVQEEAGVDLPVHTIVIALDSTMERKAPMYAYQIWDELLDAGNDLTKAVGTHNVIFGRNNNGTVCNFNMSNTKDVYHNQLVVAASQSGKGLTTLATIAAAAAHSEPIFYIDRKPDIAGVFWNYLNEMNSDECGPLVGRAFAYEGLQYYDKPLSPNSDFERYRHFEAPAALPDFDTAALGGLYTAKALTLMLALMDGIRYDGQPNTEQMRKALGYNFKSGGGLFVFDEVQKIELECWTPFVSMLDGFGEKDKKDGERGEYIKALIKFRNALSGKVNGKEVGALPGANRATTKQTPISIMMLFQTWGYVTQGKAAFKGMFGTSSLVGRVDDTDAPGEIKGNITPEMTASFKNYQWYMTGGPGTVKSDFGNRTLKAPIKPFLLFNNEEKAQEYLDNPAIWGGLPDTFRSTIVDNIDKLHLVGMLDSYGVKLSKSLTTAYDIAQNFLRLAGFDGTVDDFVLSAEPETLIDYNTLLKRAKDGARALTEPLPIPGTPEAIYVPVGKSSSDELMSFGVAGNTMATEPASMGMAGVMLNGDMPELPQVPVEVPSVAQSSLDVTPLPVLDIHTDEGSTDSYGLPDIGDTLDAIDVMPDSFGSEQPFGQFDAPFEQPQVPFGQTNAQPKVVPTHTIDGVDYVLEPDGCLRPLSGRYAPPQNAEPEMFNGQRYTAPPIMDTQGSMPYTVGQGGARVLSDPASMLYAQPLQGAEVGYKGNFKDITSDMSQKKLETAVAQRWFVLMKAGAQMVGGVGLVARVSISEHGIYINGIPLHATESIIGDSGLRITDVVDFTAMFKYYKDIKQLDLDFVSRISFGAAYSNAAIPFTQSKSLQVINFTDSNGKVIQFARQHAAQKLDIPEDKLNSKFNTWTKFASQVNKGATSSFCRPGSRLVMADYTKRLAVGAFGPGSSWSRRRKVLGAFAMLACAAGTVVTGGVQAARSVQANHR